MDIILGLPKFEGKSVIMVVVDRPTKYVLENVTRFDLHFMYLSHLVMYLSKE